MGEILQGVLSSIAFVAVVGSLLGLVFWIVRWFDRRRAGGPMSRISTNLGGTHQGIEGSALLGAERINYGFRSGGRHGPDQMAISVAVASAARFCVSRRGRESTFAKAIGLSQVHGARREIPTGDAAFDSQLLLMCDSQDTGERVFAEAPMRSGVLAIAAMITGQPWIVWYDGKCVMTCVPVPELAKRKPAEVVALAQDLMQVAAAVRQNARPVPQPPRVLPAAPDPHRHPRVVALGISVLSLALAGVVGLAFAANIDLMPLDTMDFAWKSLGAGIGTALLLALFVKQSVARPVLGPLAGVWLAVPLMFWWGGAVLNARLDNGPVLVRIVPVTAAYWQSTTFYVTVASWRPGGGQLDVRYVDPARMVKAGQSRAAIATRPGFFGFEWLESPARRPAD